jgi:signal transduction histidine kinase
VRQRFGRRRPRWADALTAGVIFAGTVALAVLPPYGRPMSGWDWSFVVIACGALLWRSRYPAAVFVITAAAAEFYLAGYERHQAVVLLVAPLLALYTVAHTQEHRRRHQLVAGVTLLLLAMAHIVVRPQSLVGAGTLALVAFGALAVAAGEATRHRRAYLAEVEARLARAERERDAEIARRHTEAARQLTEERLRIARDLHDVLGHQLAVINVQSAVAAQMTANDPGAATTALTHVRTASQTALAELRDTIGLLRGGDLSPTEPTVGLADLDRLLASFTRLGLDVHAHVALPASLPAPMDLTAYRVVQEALTNVRRHAGPVAVQVKVTADGQRLTVDVRNDRPAESSEPSENSESTSAAVPGHGLTGLRERLAALGGTLRAGPESGGGFRLTAALPIGLERP